MKYLEARAILSSFKGGDPLPLLLGISAQADRLQVWVRAFAAQLGYDAKIRSLPFNTLAQHLRVPPQEGEREVYLIFPWDLVPEADWRSGFPIGGVPKFQDLVKRAEGTAALLIGRAPAALLYVEAPILPMFPSATESEALSDTLLSLARSAEARVVDGAAFSLEGYLSHGDPISTGALGSIARVLVDTVIPKGPEPLGKVLVSDFDNVLWRGVVGEDGVSGVEHGPQGLGYRHFIYQTFLRNLKDTGILLAGVTRNDEELASGPLWRDDSVLGVEDFIAIMASYGAKSAQISKLSRELNVGLDAFVFVDDNPVELAEVSQALPEVHTVAFPSDLSRLPEFFGTLARLFHRAEVTDEDSERTEMYRRRLAGMAPSEAEGADLDSFLRDLRMVLTIRDRSESDRARPVQLINKTNQFNLNGMRFADHEVAEILRAGGRLYTASLEDKHGEHGEIACLLVDVDGVVRSFVMSCRVFQRRVEYAFLSWVASTVPVSLRFAFAETDRNKPMRIFLDDAAFSRSDSGAELSFDADRFASEHATASTLFRIIARAAEEAGSA